jgi:hypothetical protein
MQPECPHDVIEKYLTRRGLVCEACLTPADLAECPGWKERLELKHRRADLARTNFHNGGNANAGTPQ